MKIKFSIYKLAVVGVFYLIMGCNTKEDEEVIHDINFNPSITYGKLTDQDGKTYKTVTIGTQVWMAENLKTTKYRNGDPIPNVTNIDQWKFLTTGAYCNYDNNSKKVKRYGNLYNWYAVSDQRNIAPIGWHIPTNDEWETLISFLGGEFITYNKIIESQNNSITNESGFTALLGGYRGKITFGGAELGYNYAYEGMYGLWWSSNEFSSLMAWCRYINTISTDIKSATGYKYHGYSIRCIKD
jgi:uncharacterized protein (TIGR02145 family)